MAEKNEKGNEKVVEFEKRMDNHDNLVSLINESQEGPNDLKSKALGKLRKSVLDVPGSDVVDPDRLTDIDVVERGKGISGFYNNRANNYFHENYDSIIKDIRETKKDVLEKIASAEPLVKKGGEKYAKILEAAAEYRKASDIVEAYKDGKIEDPKQLIPLALKGLKEKKEKLRKELEDKNYKKDEIDSTLNLIDIAVRDGYVKKEFVDNGADVFLEEERDKFKKRTGEGKELSDYVIDVIGQLRNAGGNEFVQARNISYSVIKNK